MVIKLLVCIRLVGLNKVAPSPLLFSLYINDIDDIAEGVSGAITGTAGVHVSHMLYADDLTLLTNEPSDMQIMLSRLTRVYARMNI